MQLETPEPRETRSRRSREDEALPERRKRTEANVVGKRLAVNTANLNMEKYAYRFINDAPARLFQMTQQDDWDIVDATGAPVKSDSTDLGNAVSVVVGTKPDGSAMRAYLCRKLRRFYDDDQKMKQTDLDEQLAQLRRGNSAKGEEQGDYIPSGGIRIAR